MLTKKSLLVIPMLLIMSTGVASANNMEIKTGNAQVSIQNGDIKIKRTTSPSIIDRFVNWNLFRTRTPSSSSSQVSSNCRQSNSTYSSSRSTGGGVVQTRSSSSSTTCN